jgi:CheY-like chemotaxis protein
MDKLHVRMLMLDDSFKSLVRLAALFQRGISPDFAFDVFPVMDARMAIRLIKEEGPFQVVLSDLGLEPFDGYWFAEHYRQLDSHYKTGTILCVLTGYDTVEDRTRCKEAGFDYFFSKPFNPRGILPACAESAVHWRSNGIARPADSRMHDLRVRLFGDDEIGQEFESDLFS